MRQVHSPEGPFLFPLFSIFFSSLFLNNFLLSLPFLIYHHAPSYLFLPLSIHTLVVLPIQLSFFFTYFLERLSSHFRFLLQYCFFLPSFNIPILSSFSFPALSIHTYFLAQCCLFIFSQTLIYNALFVFLLPLVSLFFNLSIQCLLASNLHVENLKKATLQYLNLT